MVLKYKKIGQWEDFLFRQLFYVILSLSAKTALCWPIWSGTLAPAERRPPLPLFAQPEFRTIERTKAVL